MGDFIPTKVLKIPFTVRVNPASHPDNTILSFHLAKHTRKGEGKQAPIRPAAWSAASKFKSGPGLILRVPHGLLWPRT